MRDISVLLVDDTKEARKGIHRTIHLACQELDFLGDVEIVDATGPSDAQERIVGKTYVEIVDATGPSDAQERIAEKTFDLAVVDYALVDGNGFDVIRALKPYDPLRETKIIFYTALSHHQKLETALEALRLGAYTFVRKDGTQSFRQEVKRTLEAIWLDYNRAMVGSFVDWNLRQQLADPTVMSRLQEGCTVEKGFLFCDMSGSTTFIKDLQADISSSKYVGSVLREIFSWMAGIIQSKGGIIQIHR